MLGRALPRMRKHPLAAARQLRPARRAAHAAAADTTTPAATGDYMQARPSAAYLSAAVGDHSTVKPAANPVVAQLYRYTRTHEHDLLLRAFLKWTSSYVGLKSLRAALTPHQIAHFLGLVVQHQQYLIHRQGEGHAADAAKGATGTPATASAASLAFFRHGVREVYSKLLYGSQSGESIYDRAKRDDLYASTQLTGYRLGEEDYENLVAHELFCKKLDLASRWARQSQASGEAAMSAAASQPQPEAASGADAAVGLNADAAAAFGRPAVSPRHWVHQFSVYASALPSTWSTPSSDVYRAVPRRAHFRLKSAKRWEDVLQDYMRHCAAAADSTEVALLDREVCHAVVLASGHEGNVDFLHHFIERVWRVQLEGSQGAPLPRSDPRYPTLATLQAIVAAFLYNRQFYQGMAYINAFQRRYSGEDAFELGSSRALAFWNTTLEWAERTSRFDPDTALRHFLRTLAALPHLALRPNSQLLMAEAAQEADFDAEAFAARLAALAADRAKMIDDIWRLYRQSNSHFLARAFAVKLQLCADLRRGAADGAQAAYFDFMSATLQTYAQYHPSTDAGDFGNHGRNIAQLHVAALKAVADMRAFSGYLRQVEPLIEEWSLSEPMRRQLLQWAEKRAPTWQRAMEERREQTMIAQKSERDDDEEGLLDLF
jgi:ATPase expression protein 2